MASEALRELRTFGDDKFLLAQSLLDLGSVRRLQGRYSEAESLIQEGIILYFGRRKETIIQMWPTDCGVSPHCIIPRANISWPSKMRARL